MQDQLIADISLLRYTNHIEWQTWESMLHHYKISKTTAVAMDLDWTPGDTQALADGASIVQGLVDLVDDDPGADTAGTVSGG